MTATATTINANLPEVYGPSPIKRHLRTDGELTAILAAVQRIVKDEIKPTIRHVFYVLVGMKLIKKDEKEYHKLDRHLVNWRKSGDLNYDDFSDSTRWYYGTRGYSCLSDGLKEFKNRFRRDVWDYLNVHVELWVEKRAMVDLLVEAALPYCVQVFPTDGFVSDTSLFLNAQYFKEFQRNGKKIFVYYFVDFDRNGMNIQQSFLKKLKEDHGVEIHFERLAVTQEQIRQYNLPTRPPKHKNTKDFDESTELDTLATFVIKELAENAITQHLDPELLYSIELAKENDKELLGILIGNIQEFEESHRLGEEGGVS